MKVNFFIFLNALSIDVVIGAVSCMHMLSWYYAEPVSLWVYACLAGAVWSIYLLDHIVDTLKMKVVVGSYRHNLFQSNRGKMIGLWFVVTAAGGYSALQLESALIRDGLYLTMLVAVYFLYLWLFGQKKWSIKEVFIAFGYCMGICLPFYSSGVMTASILEIILLVQLYILALINLLLFSLFERKQDQAHGFSSIALFLGSPKTQKILQWLFLVFYLLTFLPFLFMTVGTKFIVIQVIYTAMSLIMLMVLLLHPIFLKNSLYRVLADLVFWFPLATFFL